MLTGRGSTVARMKRNERGAAGSVDTEDLQATVATSLSFVRKVTLQLSQAIRDPQTSWPEWLACHSDASTR